MPGPTVRDPLCEAAGGVNAAGGRCAYEFADNFNLAEDEKRTKYALVFRHESSLDLLDWVPATPVSSETMPYAGDPEFALVTVRFDRPVPAPASWFLRAIAE